MYTVDALTQSGVRPDEFPSTSHSAGPMHFWTRKSRGTGVTTGAHTQNLLSTYHKRTKILHLCFYSTGIELHFFFCFVVLCTITKKYSILLLKLVSLCYFLFVMMRVCLSFLLYLGPLSPKNLSISQVTTNSALITWDRQGALMTDGFVVNVTRGFNTRSRFLPNGKLSSHTLRELAPGQHYHVTLTAVKKAGQEQLHSAPQRLSFTTCKRK